jgi:pimeloyl-ACP methyl ester carboxylesterase
MLELLLALHAVAPTVPFARSATPSATVPYLASSSVKPNSAITRHTQRNGTVVVLPAGYDAQKTYPALVLMPPTNRTAAEFFNWAMSEAYRKRTGEPFIVILPPERGSRGDYGSGGAFEAAIAYYERSVRENLKGVIGKYSIDPSRISIGGFSLGADLAWAVSIRNPDLFKSAILIDSLCTYRLSKNLTQLSEKKFRYVLIAGRKEGGEVTHPLQNVKAILDQHNIANFYKSFPSASHAAIIEYIPDAVWMQSIDYALFDLEELAQ